MEAPLKRRRLSSWPHTGTDARPLALAVFEPRYRLMFRLVNQSRSRRFGVALADSDKGVMEEVGALCELTHFVPVPER